MNTRAQLSPFSSPRNANAEARIQAAIVEYIRAVAPDCVIFHIANGGYRTPAEAARLKWQGVLSGIPDLAVLAPGGKIHFLEVKTASGRLSPEQRAMFEKLTALGTPPAIARSIDDARAALETWRIPTRENFPPPVADRRREMTAPHTRRGDESAPSTVTETDMLMNDYLTGYVKAEDLEAGFHKTACITAVGEREFEEGRKPVVFLDIFNSRPLVLNQTNLKELLLLGCDSESWLGQDVVVHRTLAAFKGKSVPAIHLEAVRRPQVAAPARTPKLEPPAEDDAGDRPFAPIDDEIPF